MEPPSIRLGGMILIDRNCAIELMREDLKCDSIVFPSMVCGIHGRIEIEPPSSVGGSLIIMELIKRNCLRIVVIRNMESYTVISPAVA